MQGVTPYIGCELLSKIVFLQNLKTNYIFAVSKTKL